VSATAAAAHTAENSAGILEGLKHSYIEGGVWMHPIAVIQIITLAIILERCFLFYVYYGLNSNKFVAKCVDLLRENKIKECLNYAEKYKRQPIAKVTLVGLNRLLAKCDREEIQSKMDELLLQFSGVYETRLSYLASFGNIASMFGLLGTVAGMIKSFAAVAHAAPADKAALLAAGIAESMNATAYGMIVGIPALMAFTILQAQAAHKLSNLNNAGVIVYNTIAYECLEEGASSGHGHGTHAAPNASLTKPAIAANTGLKPAAKPMPGAGPLSAPARPMAGPAAKPGLAMGPKVANASPRPANAAAPVGPLRKAVGK